MQKIKTYLRAESVKAVAVDEYDNTSDFKASLTRGMQAELILTLFKSDAAENKFTASDFASIVEWTWYADSDYDLTTTPKLIVSSGISVDTDGNIHIPILETNTAEIIAYLGKAETKDLKCELIGLAAGDTTPAFVLQWEFSIRNRIGDEGGGSPAPVDDNHYTAAQVNALFAASNTVEYSADGGSSWSSDFSSGADLIRYRNHAISGAEWTSQNLLPGPQGSQGPRGSQGPQGITPVLSGGSVTTLPPGTSATAELVSSGGSTYILNLGIPQGQDGVMAFPIQPYSSDSAYPSMTCIAYNGGGYQVISGTTAGENPDNAASKFICFASKGTDGTDGDDGISPTLTVSETASGVQLITSDAQGTSSAFVSNGTDGVSPVVSATQTSSGVIIVTSDALGSTTVEVLNGSDGVLASSYQVVSALVSGAVVFPDTMPPPVYVKTDLGTMYPVEKNSLVSSGGSWTIDPAPYLAHDGVSSFTSPWTVYFAGGDKGDKGDKGDMPVLSGGSVTTLPAGSSASAEIVSSGSAYTLNLGIPAGSSGVSPVVYATQTSSGAVIVTSDALGSSTVEILNGTNGTNGISPTCSVTQVSSGAVIVTSDTSGVSSATILHGRLEGASEVVSSLTSGAIVLESEAVPVYVRTSAGTLYPVEKGTISISSGSWYIDPAAYLAYDGVSSFAGPWTVYYAGGLPDFQYIHGGSSSIVPLEHQVYQISISSGASVTVDSSGLNSSVCMTAELWLDMPSSAVIFILPAFTWIDGGAPLFSSGSTRYVITIRWNGSKFLANLAYTEALA